VPDGEIALQARVVRRIADLDAAAWDACAGADNPFVGHAFLSALETSGCCTGESGWLPLHAVLEDSAGQVLAVAPLYAKGHSYGEYVFDHAWADAYERAGGRYYPKLQVAVPFTPVPGPRLMVRPGAPPGTEAGLIRFLERFTEQQGLSSLHITFPTEDQWRRLGTAGWLLRTGQQYHWENCGYDSFDAFLSDLSSRKRKAIRRERAAVAEAGVRIHSLTGSELRPEHWDTFYRFYLDTGDRKWGVPYLNRDFFHQLGEQMADRVVLFLVERDRRWIAGALNLRGTDTLYGRYWGCLEDIPCLHFEACYYQAIAYAIEHRLRRVEAGAQGEHKIQRGYLPVRTYSAHYIRDPNFRQILRDHLAHERDLVDHALDVLEDSSPFRKTGPCAAETVDTETRSAF